MIQKNVMALLAFLLGGFLGGCTYDVQKLQGFLREPRAPVSGKEYRVLPPDVITITSQHVPEISGLSQQVRPDGKVNLPLVGEIMVAGKTPKEIEELVMQAASSYYEHVDATVVVAGYNSQKYFVFGQVASAGPMPWTGRDFLLDALAKAQPNSLAWPERIILVRGSEPQEGGHVTTYPASFNRGKRKEYKHTGIQPETPDHPRHTMVINLMAMIEKGDLSNNVFLMPNDVIYVQPNPFARVGLTLQSILFPIRPAVETVTVPTALQGAAVSP